MTWLHSVNKPAYESSVTIFWDLRNQTALIGATEDSLN